jgi:regulator of protease activity HflC (stomatin/prohibitin superfamily)
VRKQQVWVCPLAIKLGAGGCAEALSLYFKETAMRLIKKIIIAETQKGLLFKEQQFLKILPAGVYRIWDWFDQYQVQVVTLTNTLQEEIGKDLLHLALLHPDAFAEVLTQWETGEQEVGLVYQNNVLKDIKAPGQRGAYWKTQQEIRVDKLDISQDFTVPKKLAALLANAKDDMLRRAALVAIVVATVPENHLGFLMVDGETVATLKSGTHVWWRFNRNIAVTLFDGRLQNMEVNGQEILTKDRVSLRVNLSSTWQIKHAELVKAELADAKDYLYRELQLALRTVVSTQTLDELLADKNSLNTQVLVIVVEKAAAYGIEVKTVGARDIVLPGEMKAILTQVVEAQKLAEANLIKRQEETQATRSLHNTAKVMEGNPVLLRLKELEILEKITGRINTLNVYGGLEGVMNDMVRLTARSN